MTYHDPEYVRDLECQAESLAATCKAIMTMMENSMKPGVKDPTLAERMHVQANGAHYYYQCFKSNWREVADHPTCSQKYADGKEACGKKRGHAGLHRDPATRHEWDDGHCAKVDLSKKNPCGEIILSCPDVAEGLKVLGFAVLTAARSQ